MVQDEWAQQIKFLIPGNRISHWTHDPMMVVIDTGMSRVGMADKKSHLECEQRGYPSRT
jgi:alanine racemase